MPKLLDITDDEWKALTSRLDVYARGKMARLRWRGCRPAPGASGPGGTDSGDLVADAIERVLRKKRAWCDTTDPYTQLCSVIDSLVSHLATGRDNRRERSMPTTRGDDGVERPVEQLGREPEPSQILTDAEDLAEANRFQEAVRAAIADDPLVRDIFACLALGVVKPADIAETIGVPVEQIYTAKKRLQRAVESVTDKTGTPSKAKR